MIVCIEGCDASGKATQTKIITEWLREFIPANSMSFPDYSTETGKLIRQMLTGERTIRGFSEDSLRVDDRAQALALQSLMTANRYEHRDAIAPYARSTEHALVLDRYWLSGYAYGTAAGLDPDWLWQIHQALPPADVTIFLDVSVAESMRRRPERRDIYERDGALLERVRSTYAELVERGLCIRVDGEESVRDVSDAIKAIVREAARKLAGTPTPSILGNVLRTDL